MSQIIGTNILFDPKRLSARIRQKRRRNKIKVFDKKIDNLDFEDKSNIVDICRNVKDNILPIKFMLETNLSEIISKFNYEEQLLGHEGYQQHKVCNFLRTTIPFNHRFIFPTEYTATSLPKQLSSFCKLMKIERIFCSIENARHPLNGIFIDNQTGLYCASVENEIIWREKNFESILIKYISATIICPKMKVDFQYKKLLQFILLGSGIPRHYFMSKNCHTYNLVEKVLKNFRNVVDIPNFQ
uniref:Late expression factor-5 n=1 Tax=Strongyloides papillosus TaxID=174720 RepID=A0A0N5C9K8_STREA